RRWGPMVGMLMAAPTNAETPLTLPSEDRILPSSLELERRTQPWCPGNCAVEVPFVASYRKRAERLVFVGVRHAFNPNDPTMRAVKAGFSEFQRKGLSLEGFPSVMGANALPLESEVHHYGASV